MWRTAHHERKVQESFVAKACDQKATSKFLRENAKTCSVGNFSGGSSAFQLRGSEKGLRCAQAGHWSLAEQGRGIFTLVIPSTRAGDASLASDANLADIRRRARAGLQQLQLRTRPLHQSKFQTHPCRCSNFGMAVRRDTASATAGPAHVYYKCLADQFAGN